MPNRCVQCVGASAPDQCKVCKIGFLGSNVGDPTKCELKCGSNQFPQTFYQTIADNQNVIYSQECVSCPSKCKTCIGVDANNQCTSCPDGQFLTITDYKR